MAKKKYVAVRMPLEAYNNFCNRKVKMESVAKKITKRVIRIPLTKIFRLSAENPINIHDEELIKVIRRSRKLDHY